MDYYKLLHLKKEPFSNSPDPSFFYRSRQHIDCLQKLELALRLKRGLNVVVGDVGTGKTTLCRQLIQSFANDERIVSHLILDPDFQEPQAFLGAVVQMFIGKKPDLGTPLSKMKEDFKQYLFKMGVEENKTIVLIIDEGQKITASGLEILRELLNFETNEFKLLQIILFAQTEFDAVLKDHANVADRVNLYLHLSPLNFKDTRALIQFRIAQAIEGNGAKMRFFTLPALWRIYRASGGYPRKIIHLCHQCLLAMIIQNRTKAGRRLVRACAKRTVADNPRFKPAYFLSTLVLFGLAAVLWSNPGVLEKTRGVFQTQRKPMPLADPAPDQSPMETSWTGLSSQEKSLPLESPPVAAPEEKKSINMPKAPSPPRKTLAEPREAHSQQTIQPPALLGEVSVAKGETLGGMIQRVYGAYSYAYYQSILDENSHITDPNHLIIGERIRFPAVPTRAQRVPTETWWIALAKAPTLAAGVAALRHAEKENLPLRLLPHWNPKEGLNILIVYNNYFTDSVSAEIQGAQLMPFAQGEKRVVLLKRDETLFFGSPFVGKPRYDSCASVSV